MDHFNAFRRAFSKAHPYHYQQREDFYARYRAEQVVAEEAQRHRTPSELKAWLSTASRKMQWLSSGCQARNNPDHALILATLSQDSDAMVRLRAVRAAAKLADPMPLLRRAARDESHEVATSVQQAASHLPPGHKLELIHLLLTHPDPVAQGSACDWACKEVGWPKAAALLYQWASSNHAYSENFYHRLADTPMHEGMESIEYLVSLASLPKPALRKEALAALAYVTLNWPRTTATGELWDRAFEEVTRASGDELEKVAFYFNFCVHENGENLLPLWQRVFVGKSAGPWQGQAIRALSRVGTPSAHRMAVDCALEAGGAEYCDQVTLAAFCRADMARFAKSSLPKACVAYISCISEQNANVLDIAPYCSHPSAEVVAAANQALLRLPLRPMDPPTAKLYLESTEPQVMWLAAAFLFSDQEARQGCLHTIKAWAAQHPHLLPELCAHIQNANADLLTACFANLDVHDANGNTALHIFASGNKFASTQKFLAAGAKAHLRNAIGQTHLDVALAKKQWAYLFVLAPKASENLEWVTQLNRHGVDQMARDEWLALLRPMLRRPENLVAFFKALMRQEVFVLRDGGASGSTWDVLVHKLIMGGPGEPDLLAANALATHMAERMAAPAQALPMPLGDLVEAWRAEQFVAIGTQGRSIVFARPNSRERRVLKVQKAGEPLQTLHEEANTLSVLHARRARPEDRSGILLASRLPEPLGVLVHPAGIADLTHFLPTGDNAAFINLVGSAATQVGIYAYTCDADYLSYATDVAPGAKHMWGSSLRDLFTLLDQGIAFPELSNMFHNTEMPYRSDGGRYRTLNSLFDKNSGGGRLHDWRNAVEFPNLRGPRAELADFASLSMLATEAQRASTLRSRFFAGLDVANSTAASALRANFQAEALLTWELLLGRRAVDFNTWDGMADELKDMYSYAVALCAEGRGLPPEHAMQVVEVMRGSVNWERYAAQMQTFMTPTHAAYIATGGPFPEGLFDMQPSIGRNREDSFDPKRGYVGTDGKRPSLGPVNGPNPIKAGEQARAMVAILDHLMAQTSRVIPLGTKVGRPTPDVAAMLVSHAGFFTSASKKQRLQKTAPQRTGHLSALASLMPRCLQRPLRRRSAARLAANRSP